MNSSRTSCRIIIERSGKPLIEEVVPDPDAVQSIVKGLEGEPDATVTVERDDLPRIAVTSQLPEAELSLGSTTIPMGYLNTWQPTRSEVLVIAFPSVAKRPEIDPRYVLSVTAAADVAQQWAAGSDDLRGSWEAQ